MITIRLGGIAARNRPMGRKAASAFKKSLKVFSLKEESATRNYIIYRIEKEITSNLQIYTKKKYKYIICTGSKISKYTIYVVQ